MSDEPTDPAVEPEEGEVRALTPVERSELAGWEGAADRGLRAREERLKIIEAVLTAEEDYGLIPGTKKPTLLKPGAEKIADALNLRPEYQPLREVEDFEHGLFFYRYRCLLVTRTGDVVVSTGIGSCNSYEPKYRWRKGERVCPSCGRSSLIRSKYKDEETGEKPWVCWARDGEACGAHFSPDDVAITSQNPERVPNPDPAGDLNTIDKIAQKRALVAATLNLGFSDRFTQDLEDRPAMNGQAAAEAAKPKSPRRRPKRKSEPDDDSGTYVGPIRKVERRKVGASEVFWLRCNGLDVLTLDSLQADLANTFATRGTEVSLAWAMEDGTRVVHSLEEAL